MVRDIMTDETFLAMKCAEATPEDEQVAQDLLDTFEEHSEECVGLAANMIGVLKRIIVFDNNGKTVLMYNPVIVSKAVPYKTQEGCLSLEGMREVKRFTRIRVKFQDKDFNWQTKAYRDWTAQIIQHEVDHCNGIVV